MTDSHVADRILAKYEIFIDCFFLGEWVSGKETGKGSIWENNNPDHYLHHNGSDRYCGHRGDHVFDLQRVQPGQDRRRIHWKLVR